MERRTLGSGLEVSAIGLGCMGMIASFPRGGRYSQANEQMIDR
jgi:aryl-alcohol dehydrogenase-like predicted oxidoreductase